MNDIIAWIAAEEDGPEEVEEGLPPRGLKAEGMRRKEISVQGIVAHQFPARVVTNEGTEVPPFAKEREGWGSLRGGRTGVSGTGVGRTGIG